MTEMPNAFRVKNISKEFVSLGDDFLIPGEVSNLTRGLMFC
jgi:hypothetical protein